MNSQNVLKKLFGSAFVLLALSGLGAIEVNRNEIQSTGNENEIVFRNYSGPHSVINTVEQIREIGASLGRQVSADTSQTGTFGSSGRYAIIHALDDTTGKFDADILIIGRNATVDHITNLRRIISAYLSSAYGYSNRDADTIATFATVYNAVYRGNLDYFKSRYKDVVTGNLSASIVGLSTNYEEWPGGTQIVIPLSDLNGGLSTVDTSTISDKEVIKSMQGDEDKGIDARKGMVDIKEREADNAQEKADEAQAKADAEKARLAEEQRKKAEADAAAAKAKADADKKAADAAKAKADADKKAADAAKAKADADKKNAAAADAQKKADDAKKNANANKNDAQAQKDAADAQKKADDASKDASQAQSDADNAQRDASDAQKDAESAQQDADAAKQNAADAQNAADEQSQKTAEQAQNAQNAQDAADSAQAAADKKRDEAQDERTAIAKDQQSLIEANYTSHNESIMYGLKNVDDAGVTSEIVKMDAQKGTVIKESPVTVIRGRTVYDDGDNFIAVAGTNFGNAAVRLVQIDKKNLEIVTESNEKLSEFSVLVEKNGNYYCTVQDGSDYYIGKFNNRVELQLKSKVKVKGASPITITNQGIMVTDANGQPIILRESDLVSISPESQPDNRSVIQRAADNASTLYNDAK